MDVRVSVTATGIEEDTDIQSEGGGGELSESDLPSRPLTISPLSQAPLPLPLPRTSCRPSELPLTPAESGQGTISRLIRWPPPSRVYGKGVEGEKRVVRHKYCISISGPLIIYLR